MGKWGMGRKVNYRQYKNIKELHRYIKEFVHRKNRVLNVIQSRTRALYDVNTKFYGVAFFSWNKCGSYFKQNHRFYS
jgi:hypothetical protein